MMTGFQLDLIREKDTISAYLNDVLEEEICVSRRKTQSSSVWWTFASCENIPTESGCLCCNGVHLVAGITNEIKMSY